MNNPLLGLEALGQSVWMDFLRRGTISSGELERLIDEDGLSGVTSNPSIFEKAIVGSHDYDESIRALALEGKTVDDIYQSLVVDDIQRAADLFRPAYDRTEGGDGFVSLEVSPHLAHDTEGSVAEARRLWAALNRPNVFIKVPGTREGLPAIRQLIGEGINVNVTLLFGLPRYREVAEAYISGLEDRVSSGKPVDRVASVASFFLSRIDVLLDPTLEKKMQVAGPDAGAAKILHGEVATASAKIGYQIYNEIFASARFRALASHGAKVQRLLWASTSTKNPAYSDVKYVEPLIGMDTINTMPLETINAYRDHGDPAPRLAKGTDEATLILQQLPAVGIDLDQATQQLEDEGVQKFVKPFDTLMSALKAKRTEALSEAPDREALSLGSQEKAVRDRVASLAKEHFAARLWRKDATLWKTAPREQEQIRNSLGWLTVTQTMEECLGDLEEFRRDVTQAGFQHVVHMGMGGSSLAPLVFASSFAPGENGLPLTVLDTTDPATILGIERRVPLANTLFIVASKSGTTAEPSAFGEYFYARVREQKGERAGENFVAITDPGSPMVDLAAARGFRKTFLNFPDIGGRYSALSYFGLVPAALMGMDVGEFLVRALRMVHAGTSSVPDDESPALVLGAALGELGYHWQDKLTFLVPDAIGTLGLWLEQLLAESTGKEGTGILPVAGEPLGIPATYGDDRIFVLYRLKSEPDEPLTHAAAALQEAGHPVITITLEDRLDLAQEFFRWEMATATAGAVLKINPFDQPNVQESKDNTNRLLAMVRDQGSLPESTPALVEGALSLYSDSHAPTIEEALRYFFGQAAAESASTSDAPVSSANAHDASSGSYIAILAYLPETPETNRTLQSIRALLRDKYRVATTAGYGPRYLHSTGQFHKGGPNTGLYLELTADDAEDIQIPGQPYTFGTFKQAQALGDLEALHRHGRRAVRIHLGKDVARGLLELEQAVKRAITAKGVTT